MQNYSNEGSNVPLRGEYASLDEMAQPGPYLGGVLSAAETLRASLVEGTEMAVTDTQVNAPISIPARSAVLFTVLDTDGTEYEVIVREKA